MTELILAAERFLSSPLAMEESAIRSIAAAVSRLKAGGPVAAAGSKRDGGRAQTQRMVAVIGIYGPMVPRADIFTELFGGAPLDLIGAALDEAMNNPAYSEVVLDFDSPGGSVFGTEELADKVYQGRKKKRITAVANGMMASAAYFVGSQANELVASPSSMVGSIGVYLTHADYSRQLDAEGLKVTLIASSAEKVAGNMYEPLSEAGRNQMQATVSGYYSAFLGAVARGRNVGPGEVQAKFGKGGVVLAKDAVGRGMADRVGTFDGVLQAAIGRASGPTALAGTGAATPKAFDFDLELRKRKLRLSLSDDKATLARLSAPAARPVANLPPSSPPPKPTRPAGRTAARDREIAYHEAGHVVAAMALRVQVFDATIQPGTCPTQGGWEGRVSEGSRPRSLDKALICLAGTEVEQGFCGTGFLRGPDAELVAEAGLSAGGMEQAKARVRRIIRDNPHAIRAVANALLVERTMNESRLKEVAGHVYPG